MRRIWMVMALMLMLVSSVPAQAEDVWLFAVNVGKGDAILVGVENTVCLIDTGYPHVRGKILGAMKALGVSRLDAVFLTHTDRDHTGGLEWLSESSVEVGAWYGSAYCLDTKEKDHPLTAAAGARGQSPVWLKAGDRVTVGAAAFDVVGPVTMAEDKDDNNSLVMRLETREGSILLCGDMELNEEDTILESGANLKADVLKVPNHGDSDTTSREFAAAVSPQVSVISTSSAEKPGTPSEKVVRRLQQAGSEVAVTQDASLGVYVMLSGGRAAWSLTDSGKSEGDVRIAAVTPGDDTIDLVNEGGAEADLSGWYLFSDKGNELFVLPEGTRLGAGATLRVGTLSTKGETDLVWQDKKVIHAKKSDEIRLYDAWGNLADSRGNGL